MRRSSIRMLAPVQAALSLLANHCFSQEPKPEGVEVVALTLQAYQADKVTIQDFVRDAGLVNVSFPPPFDEGPNPTAGFFLQSYFQPTNGSPWKIYDTSLQETFGFRSQGGTTRTRKYVVGDTNKALNTLVFRNDGKLESIFLVTNSAVGILTGMQRNERNPSPPLSAKRKLKPVAQTLQSYEVGKTTITNFTEDAHLTESPLSPATYPNSAFPIKMFETNFLHARTEAPWAIYKTSVERNLSNGVTVTHIRRYVVGDTNKPISMLEFDKDGRLVKKSPAQ